MESAKERWLEVMGPFATALSKSLEGIETALKELVGDPSDAALALLQSESDTPYDELVNAIGEGVPKAVFRAAVRKHLRDPDAATQAVAAAAAVAGPVMGAASIELLPPVISEEAWLKSLQTGGVLKVDKVVVISGVRSALAVDLGLFSVPRKLRAAMQRQANSLDEPVGPEFFEIEQLLTRRKRADVLNTIGGGRKFATLERRKELITRLRQHLMPSLVSFHDTLQGWLDSWQKGFNNPGLIMMVVSGQKVPGGMPAGMLQAPDTAGVRDSAETVVNNINRAFAGLGIPVANAMAVEVAEIQKILATPNLPALTGAANKEQMLKQLGLAVDADFVRLEQNLVRYVMAIMDLAKVTEDQATAYLSAMAMLGTQIPWGKLGDTSGNAVVGDPEEDSAEDDDDFEDEDSDELVGSGSGSRSGGDYGRWSS